MNLKGSNEDAFPGSPGYLVVPENKIENFNKNINTTIINNGTK